MQVTVRLFGSVRDEVGSKEIGIELAQGSTVEDLRALLADRYPIFDRLGDRVACSVNLEIAETRTRLAAGDEVAFLPPVSGGSGAAPIVSLSEEPLDEQEVARRVTGPEMGGVVTFVGLVRDHARGRLIEHLEYEAYPEMALREMEKIADEVAKRWAGARLAIAHRTGHLKVGEAAVVIVAATPHRAEAFEACRFAIDTLKQTVPIWKKEFATDGHYWVDDRP